jgi:hypothetical protein
LEIGNGAFKKPEDSFLMGNILETYKKQQAYTSSALETSDVLMYVKILSPDAGVSYVSKSCVLSSSPLDPN